MILDINVSIGHWPFKRLRPNTLEALAAHLAGKGIDRACVSSIDAVLYPDPMMGNEEVLPRLRGYPHLVPVAVLNPSLANWRRTLDRCIEVWGARMVKLFPNYHAYPLDAPFVSEFVEAATAQGLPVAVSMRVEDERAQYPLMKIPGVSVDDLLALARRFPSARFIALCPYFPEAERLPRDAENVWVDIAYVERKDTLRSLLRTAPAGRVLFGSHTPFLYTQAALNKLADADIPDAAKEAIASGNAQGLFGF